MFLTEYLLTRSRTRLHRLLTWRRNSEGSFQQLTDYLSVVYEGCGYDILLKCKLHSLEDKLWPHLDSLTANLRLQLDSLTDNHWLQLDNLKDRFWLQLDNLTVSRWFQLSRLKVNWWLQPDSLKDYS